eukprot:TRINITY_DN12597_c0_g1_i1.p1 TRINITY_DN12597_c0_g1~~TRINITY_DN12597_c0_g1_i1.p1  ORF type:complete len:186 (-),score=35.34 TRINITY_DN12597_c0_g1_i1:38-595(-)
MMYKLLLVFALLFVSGCYAEEKEGAFLLVTKSILHHEIITNRDTVVTLQIFNVGDSPAYDVKLRDNAWPEEHFTRVIGVTTANWDRIPAGANVSHSFIVKPNFVGDYEIHSAVVEYKKSPKGAVQLGYSTSPGDITVLPRSDIERRKAPHLKEWAIFLVLSGIAIAPPLALWSSYQKKTRGGARK